jgi:YVTN family beta-propeller protein
MMYPSLLKSARWLRLAFTALVGAVAVFAQPGAFTQYAYVSNYAGGVSVVNGTTGTVVGSPIPLTGPLTGLALAGGQLYVAQSGANSVTVVNAASNDLLATIPVGSTPLRLAATPTGQTVYVVNNGSNTVSAISTASNTVIATIPVGTGPTSLAVTPDGSRVFVANPTSGTVSVISTASNTVTATWTFAAGVNGVAVSPDGLTLYVSDISNNTVKICNAASGSPIATIGGLHYPDSMALTPDGKSLYVSNRGAASVSVINTASRGIVATVGVGAAPISVAISWDGSDVYVANYNANSLSVISTATNSVVQTVTATMASPYSVVVTNLCSPAPAGLPAISSEKNYGSGTQPLVLPSLPQGCYAPTYPGPTNNTVTVTTAAALQTALTGAACGEKIVVTAGITYDGAGFTVPALPAPGCGTNPVLVVSSAIASLPQYTIPSQSLAGSASVPTIECNVTNCSALSISDGAAGWYFAGLEFTLDPAVTVTYPVVVMGDYTATAEALPNYITFDRCLIHPNGSSGASDASRGIDLNAVYGTVMFSNIWGFISNTKDTQAIFIYNTTGPDLVTGNHLEATGENVAIFTICATGVWVPGYGIPSCPPPSDITVTRNHLLKNTAWYGGPSGCASGSGTVTTNGTAVSWVSGTTFAPGEGGQNITIDSVVYTIASVVATPPYTSLTLTTSAGVQSTPVAFTLSSSGPCYEVKNSLECKHCQRVLVDSNWFDTTFSQGQDEFTIVNCVFSGVFVCTDMTYTNNLFEHGPTVGVLAGNGNTSTGQKMLFRNNLAVDISAVSWGGYGWTWEFQNTANVTVDHNTMLNKQVTYNNGIFWGDPPPSTNTAFQWTNSFNFGSPFADGDNPGQTIADLPSPTFGGTVFVGDYWPCLNSYCTGTPPYPSGIQTVNSTATPNPPNTNACNVANAPIAQCWPLDWALVGFLDFTGGSAGTDLPGMALAQSSPWYKAGTDTLDVGANVPAILAAVSGVQ